MLVHRNAAAVIADAEAAIDVDLDLDVAAVTGQRLVDTVVDQLVDEVMQPLGAGVADVHAGALADVGGVTVDLNVFSAVMVGNHVARPGASVAGQFGIDNDSRFFGHSAFLTN